MIKPVQIRTAMTLVALMLLSSILPGCLETVSDVIEEDESTHPNAAPKEAMGMWWPTIDGVIEIPTVAPITEWSDGDMIDIKFTDEASGEHPATLRYKSVEEGVALAVEIDDVEETPQQIVVTFPDRTLTTEITAESDAFLPIFELDCTKVVFDCSTSESKKTIDKTDLMSVELLHSLVLNKIASVHDLDDDNLVMEASAKRLFDDTTEITYTIDIVFEESTWTFTKVTDFDWVLPFIFPRSDISVTGIEVTQTTQTADMQIPLVEGKTSLARVYVDSGDLETANVEVTLNFCILIFCFDEMIKPHEATKNPDRNVFADSVNFILPDHWVTHEGIDGPIPIGLIATVKPLYPTGAIDYLDPDTSNNYFLQVIELNPTHDFKIFVLPTREDVQWDTVNGLVTRSQGWMEYTMDSTEAVFPVGNLDVTYLPSVLSTDLTDATNSEVIDWLNLVDAFLSTGIEYDHLFGARPSRKGGLSDPVSGGINENGRVTTCGDRGSTSRQLCAAHEIIHNIGPIDWDGDGDGFSGTDSADLDWGSHLDSCGGGFPDEVFESLYGTSSVSENILDLGWDPNVPNPDENVTSLMPSGYPDLMSYCMAGSGPVDDGGLVSGGGNDANTGPPYNLPYVTNQTKWISSYHYLPLFDYFSDWDSENPPYLAYGSDGGIADDDVDGRQTQSTSYRVVRGIAPDDKSNPTLLHSWTFEGELSTRFLNHGDNIGSSKYNIVVLDINGNVLDSAKYIPNFEILHAPENHTEDDYFSFYFIDDGLIESIEIRNSATGSMIDSLNSTGSPVTRVMPLGTTEYTRENPANLSWTQASPTSNRQTLYQLEYSWGADIWLPIGGMTSSTNTVLDFGTLPATVVEQGSDSKFRVRATNGFDTYYSESTSFSLPNQAPELTLETSGALGFSPHDWDTRVQVRQGDSFSISPEITDADWTSINKDGFSVVMKRDGKELRNWGGDTSRSNGDRISTFAASKISLDMGVSVPECSIAAPFIPGGAIVGGTMCSFHFPNSELLPGEMIPGDYDFEMTYEDEAGSSVTKTVSFSIIVPNYLVGIRIDDDAAYSASTEYVLDEYRSKLEMMSNISKMNNDLSRDELQYYVELQRVARGDTDALPDAEIDNLQNIYGISDSRVAEIKDIPNEVNIILTDTESDNEVE